MTQVKEFIHPQNNNRNESLGLFRVRSMFLGSIHNECTHANQKEEGGVKPKAYTPHSESVQAAGQGEGGVQKQEFVRTYFVDDPLCSVTYA